MKRLLLSHSNAGPCDQDNKKEAKHAHGAVEATVKSESDSVIQSVSSVSYQETLKPPSKPQCPLSRDIIPLHSIAMPGSGGTQDFEFLSNVEYGMFAVSSHGCCEYADISLQVLSKLRWYFRRPTNYVPCWFCGAGEAVGCCTNRGNGIWCDYSVT